MAKPKEYWARAYLVAWLVWIALAAALGITGGFRLGWYGLGLTFGALEGLGGLRRGDEMPMLTEVFGRYIPGFVLFPVLSLAVWRLSAWVPGWLLFPFSGWTVWHFFCTLHDYQKMGGPDARLR